MAVDYLKTYLGIDPDDYSSMEARIRGEEPQAQVPLMRQPTMMPQTRSLGEMEAMPMAPRSQPTPQVDDRYQSLMDEIASLKAQIEGMQAPTEQVATDQAPVMAGEPSMMDEQDVFSSWRNSPEKAAYDAKGIGQTMDYRPKNYTDPVTGQVFKLDDRSGTFADYYKKTYGRDLAVEDDSFRGSLGETQLNFGTEQPPQGSNNFGDYRDEMENTPPERPDYNGFRPDLDTGFIQIQNPDAEGILKYGNDPRKLESLKPQYDEYLNLFDRLKLRSRVKYKLTPEGRERQRQEEARFKELYNIFGVIGTGGAFSPMTTDSSMEGFNRDDMDANYVYSQFAIDQPDRPMVEQITFESPFPTPNLNIPNPMTGETPDGSPYQPQPLRTPGYDTLSPNQPTQVLQAPPELQNRMVGEPQPIPQAPSQDIQASIDYLAKLPKMNIPQIPDIEQIRQKMEEANMTFPEPVSYQDQLQAIKDLPPVTPMPQAIKQPSRSGIFGNLLDRVQKPNQMPQSRRGGFFGNLLDRVQKQIEVPTPPSMPASPMLQTKPAYMPTRTRSMLDIQQKFAPQRFADGGGINKAIYDLKFKLNG